MKKEKNKLRMKFFNKVLLASIFSLGLLASQEILASTTLEIAKSEDSIPGEDSQFGNLGTPTINSGNNLIFSARLLNTTDDELDDSGIYRMQLGSTLLPTVTTLEEIAREGTPFSVSTKSFDLDDLYLSVGLAIKNNPVNSQTGTGEFNNLALVLPLIDGSGEFGNSIIVVESGGSFSRIAESGQTVGSSNGEYRDFNALSIRSISSNSDVTFFAALDNTENDSEDNTAIFKRFNNGNTVEVVRKGDSANGATLTHLASIYSNDFGQSVFSGQNDSENDRGGLYKISTTSYSLVVHEGDLAPSDEADDRFFSQLSVPRINNQEEIAFTGEFRDENGMSASSGLFLANNLSVKPILLEGQSTPDGSATYRDFLGGFGTNPPVPALNDVAQLSFTIDLNGESGLSQGVFLASENEVIEIARKGNVYEDGTFRRFLDPALNNHGYVVFHADLELDEVDEVEGGIIIDDILVISDGVHYETIARQGEERGNRTILDIIFNNNTSGQANGLSDSGAVIYKVLYEGGGNGIYVWLPEFGWRSEITEGDWDDVSNWNFGGLPNQFSDVVLDLEQDLDLQGPIENVIINALSLGGGTGIVNLILGGSTLTINEGMTINFSSILSGHGTLESTVQNNGQIEILENLALQISDDTINNGVIRVNTGSELSFSSLFKGSETIQGSGTVIFNGALQFGDEPALLSVESNVIFGENSNLQIKINGLERGTSYDALDVGASITLAGTLDIQFSESLSLKNGDIFELVKANQISSEFEQINLPDLQAQGLRLVANSSTSKIEIVVESIEIEEPSESSSGGGSLTLLLILLLFMQLRRVVR